MTYQASQLGDYVRKGQVPSGGEKCIGPKVVSKVLGIAVGKHRASLGLSDRERGLHANESTANSTICSMAIPQ